MTLDEALHRQCNNLDLLRLSAACAVIIGHAHALVPQPESDNLVRTLLHFDYSGSLAVNSSLR